jgi:hypothetical protein
MSTLADFSCCYCRAERATAVALLLLKPPLATTRQRTSLISWLVKGTITLIFIGQRVTKYKIRDRSEVIGDQLVATLAGFQYKKVNGKRLMGCSRTSNSK